MNRRVLVLALAVLLGVTLAPTASGTESDEVYREHDGYYLVVLEEGASADAAATLIATAGGTVTNDLSTQIGVLMVTSDVVGFADTLRASDLVEAVGTDFSWKGIPDADQVEAFDHSGDDNPEQTQDPLEPQQWDMMQIRAPQAHDIQAGRGAVDVGVLDTGIDGAHADFVVDEQGSNVDCARGRDSVAVGPGVGTPVPCSDNNFHGTHVAGTIGAQANGVGIVGVAPNVTLIPVKVCDSTGYCYASSVVDGITYAGDQAFNVINMSFFVDDNELLQSTEFKCNDDPEQRAFRRAVERAIQYARSQGVTPVAALGNSDADLAHPEESDPTVDGNECEVVPAETQGVIGTAALGRDSEKASYSNYGTGPTDVVAPGGNGTTGDCETTVLSTFPGNSYACIQGTSMASPHAAGVAALIVSQFGTIGGDGDITMSPTKVEEYLEKTAIDIGEPGYDECFGNGRVDALRAVQHDTSNVRDETAPDCPEYKE